MAISTKTSVTHSDRDVVPVFKLSGAEVGFLGYLIRRLKGVPADSVEPVVAKAPSGGGVWLFPYRYFLPGDYTSSLANDPRGSGQRA